MVRNWNIKTKYVYVKIVTSNINQSITVPFILYYVQEKNHWHTSLKKRNIDNIITNPEMKSTKSKDIIESKGDKYRFLKLLLK